MFNSPGVPRDKKAFFSSLRPEVSLSKVVIAIRMTFSASIVLRLCVLKKMRSPSSILTFQKKCQIW